MEEEKREVKSKGEKRIVDLKFNIPENFPTLYATELGVQAIHTEFVLTFFEIKIPMARTRDDMEKAITESLRADCVARIAMSAEKIPDVIKALQDRFNAFVKEREKEATEEPITENN